MNLMAGMLADRFHCNKLILIVVVASVAVFHTSLLHIDARISSEVQSSGSDFETPAEIFCSRMGAVLRSENYSCDASSSNHREMWTVDWTLSQCRPMDCHGVPEPGCSSASRTATARKSRPDRRPCWKWTPARGAERDALDGRRE